MSEFFGNTLAYDNDHAMIYCIWRRAVASPWLHYGINIFLWLFIKYQIMSYVLNFPVKILLLLIYDLGSAEWLFFSCYGSG
jgi:hypothetical protein